MGFTLPERWVMGVAELVLVVLCVELAVSAVVCLREVRWNATFSMSRTRSSSLAVYERRENGK
jgi:hypothetical protein